ncbi:MAG: putative quinol monooxygenase [Acidimicrobiales bacterium]
MAADADVTVMTMAFEATHEERLGAVLAAYVVTSRGQPGCLNIDLCASVTRPGRYLVLEKWATRDAQRQHLDSPAAVEMAAACSGLLVRPPEVDLWDGISAHDLR